MIGSSPALNLSEVGKTNYYHSEEEKQIIRDTLRRTNHALQRLEIEKKAMALRENALKSDIKRYRIALAPINQLPCDVLCCMFELYCRDEFDELPVRFPFRSKPPQITLSQICSAWRRAMLDSPRLWSNIVIALRWNVRFDKVVKIANAWLSRAKDLPCSVKFDFTQSFTARSEYQPVWQQDWHKNIIKNFVSRRKFKRLDVTFADHHLRYFLRLPDEKLSCIEDLCLRHVSKESDDHSGKWDFGKLVNLTSFSLLPNPFILTPPGGHISKFTNVVWHQLRHIKLRVDVPVLFCLTIMEHSSATLETCSLVVSNDGSSVPPFPYRKPIHCIRLRDFIVDVFSSDAVKVLDPFLLSLRMPNLKSLTLGSRDLSMPINPQTLITMQSISSMHLEELVISDTASDIDVQVLLTRFPSLRCLELPMMVKFTVAAMSKLGAGSIGANLEVLKIKATDLEIVPLLQMVKARSSKRKKGSHKMRGAKLVPFKSVVFHCDHQDGTVGAKVCQLIREIERLDVSLELNFPADESRSDYSDEYSGLEYEFDTDMMETFGLYY